MKKIFAFFKKHENFSYLLLFLISPVLIILFLFALFYAFLIGRDVVLALYPTIDFMGMNRTQVLHIVEQKCEKTYDNMICIAIGDVRADNHRYGKSVNDLLNDPLVMKSRYWAVNKKELIGARKEQELEFDKNGIVIAQRKTLTYDGF